jgi:methyltransferase
MHHDAGGGMKLLAFTWAVILGLLIAEARLSRRHEVGLAARGAIAPPGDVYRWMAVLYPLSFVLMGAEGAWRASVVPSWFAAGVLLFAASKALKYWAIRSLGDRWSFRVYVVPGAPLVTTGPYRYVAHPNYLAVAGELVGAAMMMNARVSGPVMVAVFGAVLWARIRFENRILASMAGVRVGR